MANHCGQFIALIRRKQYGNSARDEEELRKLFNDLDADGSGKLDLVEYVRWELSTLVAESPEKFRDRIVMGDYARYICSILDRTRDPPFQALSC